MKPEQVIPDNPNWRRFKTACPLYRERLCIESEQDGHGGRLLYQIICLQNTPPLTEAEQDRCMRSRTSCWRLQEAAKVSRKKKAATV